MGEQASLHIHLLGNFRVEHKGVPVAGLSRPRLQTLFAWFVLHAGAPQSRAATAGRFWPESSQEQAQTNLRKALLDLRRSLPEYDLFLSSDRLSVEWRVDAPYTLDVAAFQRAVAVDTSRAIGLYGGDLLPDSYDDWVVEERERLRRIYLAALQTGISQAEEARDFRTAAEYAERVRRLEPLSEEAYRRLMGLYERTGEYAAALRTYHLCASTLDRELGIEPSEATQEAYLRLRRHTEHDAVARPATRPPLVGRSHEMTELRSRWSQTEAGAAGAVLLVGEPGIGKTRLAEELVEWVAHRGSTVASAACYADEGTLSFGVVAELLRTVSVPPLDRASLSEVSRLLPEITRDRPDIPVPGPLTEQWQRRRLFEALARFLLAHQPLLLVIDDLQWCDGDSLEWLHFLLRYDPGAQMLMLCTLRTEGIGVEGERAMLWSDLRRRGRVWEMAIGPLGRDAAETLARRGASAELDGTLLDRLMQETEGNPLFVLEVVRTGNAAELDKSPNVRTRIESRLAQLSPRAREFAELAATYGRAFPFSLLARASDWSERESVQALDELWRCRIVREQGGDMYDFSHDTLREVAYSRLSEVHRRLLHRQVASALEEAHANGLDAVAEQIGRHWERGGMPERAIGFYEQAGDAARRLYANASALALYRRALALADARSSTAHDARVRMMLKCAELLQLIGKPTEAETVCRQALATAKQLGEAQLEARTLLLLGDLIRLAGRGTEANTYLEAARDTFDSIGDQARACRTAGLLGRVAWDLGLYPRALELLETHLQLCGQLGDELSRAEALGTIGLIHWRRADIVAAERYLREQTSIAREEQDREQLSRALVNLAIILAAQGRYEETLRLLREEMEAARSIGYARGLSHALSWIGIIHRQRGEMNQALRVLKRQLQLAREMEDRPLAALARHQIGMTHHQLGDYKNAHSQFVEALALTGGRDDLHLSGAILTSLGTLYADAGDYKAALLCQTASAHLALNISDLFGVGPALASLGCTLFEQNCVENAHALLDRALTSLLPQQYERCEYLQRHAQLLFEQKQYEAARERNDEARHLAEAIGRPGVRLCAALLAIALDHTLGIIAASDAVQGLEALLPVAEGEAGKAAVHFAIWRLDSTCDESRATAADAYRRLYQRTPAEEWRKRYRLLTGQDLPPQPRLPQPPAIASRYALDPEELIARFDDMSRTAW